MRTDPDALFAYLCFASVVVGLLWIPWFCYRDGQRVEREHRDAGLPVLDSRESAGFSTADDSALESS